MDLHRVFQPLLCSASKMYRLKRVRQDRLKKTSDSRHVCIRKNQILHENWANCQTWNYSSKCLVWVRNKNPGDLARLHSTKTLPGIAKNAQSRYQTSSCCARLRSASEVSANSFRCFGHSVALPSQHCQTGISSGMLNFWDKFIFKI